MVEIHLLEREDDLLASARVFRTAMVGLPFPGLKREEIPALFEPGRTYGAFEDGTLVGTTDSYSGVLTVPGGASVAQAAVTHVGVLPGHTRRGISTALAQRQLGDGRARGEVFASLRASDARIYAHFGYGVASSAATFEIDKEKARPLAPLDGHHHVRLVDPDCSWDVLERIYREHRPDRPGVIARTRYWWDFQKYKRSLFPGPAYLAVHGEPGREDGYVRYHPVGLEDWFVSSQRTIVVDDLIARSTAAYRALIGHLLNVDLVHRIMLPNRPLDDAVQWLFADQRAVRLTGVRDETWLRILDVERALSARSYASDDAMRIGIEDRLLPENARTIRLSGKAAEPTNEAPQARFDVSTLASAYLGGAKWWQLAQAGRVRSESERVIERLDALFAVPQQPHSGTMF